MSNDNKSPTCFTEQENTYNNMPREVLEILEKDSNLVMLAARLYCGEKPVIDPQAFENIVSMLLLGVGNIAERDTFSVQHGSEKVAEVIGKLVMELVQAVPALFTTSLDTIKILLTSYVNGVYAMAALEAAQRLLDKSHFPSIAKKIQAMYRKPASLLTAEKMVAPAYAFLTVTEELLNGQEMLEIRIQIRYSQDATDHPMTIIRDQGAMILVRGGRSGSGGVSCIPIESYPKSGQDTHDRQKAARSLDFEQLTAAVAIIAEEEGFVDKRDGSLARVGFTILHIPNRGWMIIIAASTAGSGVRALSECALQDLVSPNQTQVAKATVEIVARAWEDCCGVDEMSGLRGALTGVLLEMVHHCSSDLDLANKPRDFQETFTMMGEFVVPGNQPGSVGIGSSPYFELHDPRLARRLNSKGYDITVNPSYEHYNVDKLSQEEVDAISDVLGFQLRPGITRGRILLLTEAVQTIGAWAQRPVSELKALPCTLEALLAKYFGQLYSECNLNFGSHDLPSRMEVVTNYFIYNGIHDVQLPEGLISFRFLEADNLVGHIYTGQLKLKNTIWMAFHRGTTYKQTEVVHGLVEAYHKLLSFSVTMAKAVGDRFFVTPRSIQSRTQDFMQGTGSFLVQWDFMQEHKADIEAGLNYLPLMELLLQALRSEYGSAKSFIKQTDGDTKDVEASLMKAFPNGCPNIRDIDLLVNTFRSITSISPGSLGHVIYFPRRVAVPGMPVEISTTVLTQEVLEDMLRVLRLIDYNDHDEDMMDTIEENIRGQMAFHLASQMGPTRFNQLIQEVQPHMVDWCQAIAGGFVEQIMDEDPLFALLDWDGTAAECAVLRGLLMKTAVATGRRLCILTGNRNLDCYQGYFDGYENYVMICSIGDALKRTGTHPFLIPHLTAQIKAWVMLKTREGGSQFILVDDSQHVMTKAIEMGVEKSVIPYRDNTGEILIQITNFLADQLEMVLQTRVAQAVAAIKADSQLTKPERKKMVNEATVVAHQSVAAGIYLRDLAVFLQVCSVHLTTKEGNYDTAIEVIKKTGTLSSFDNIFLKTKTTATLLSEMTTLPVPQPKPHHAPVITVEGGTGSGKSVFAAGWELVHGGKWLHLTQDAFNYPAWSPELQQMGTTMRVRMTKLLSSLGIPIIISACKLPKAIKGDLTFRTDGVPRLTESEIRRDLAAGRREENSLEAILASREQDAPHGLPADVTGKVIFAAVEDDGLGKKITAEHSWIPQHQFDWRETKRNGKPHLATCYGAGVRNHRSQDDGKTCHCIGAAVFSNQGRQTAFLIFQLPSGQVSHETILADWYSGGAIHQAKLTEIAQCYLELLPTGQAFETDVVPGVGLKVIGFEEGQYQMHQKSYYHMAAGK